MMIHVTWVKSTDVCRLTNSSDQPDEEEDIQVATWMKRTLTLTKVF